ASAASALEPAVESTLRLADWHGRRNPAIGTTERPFAARVIDLSGPPRRGGGVMDEPTSRKRTRAEQVEQDFDDSSSRHVPCRSRGTPHRRRQSMQRILLVVPCVVAAVLSSACGPLGGTMGTAGELGNGVFSYACTGASDATCDGNM